MTIRTLRWTTVVVPTAFVVVFELATRSLYGDILPAWGHTAVILAAASAGAFLFSSFVFATMGRLEHECDALVVLATPEPFFAVGEWYRRFDQTSDEEVVAALARAAVSRP